MSFFFFLTHPTSSYIHQNNHIHKVHGRTEDVQYEGGNETRSNGSTGLAGVGDEDDHLPSCRSQGCFCPMRDAAVPARRAAAELESMNGRGERPPVPTTPPCRSRLRSRRWTKSRIPASPGFRTNPPPGRRPPLDLAVDRGTARIHRSAGARGAGAPARSSTSAAAGEEKHLQQKPRPRHPLLHGAAGCPRRTYLIYTREAGIPHPPAAEAAAGGRGIRRIDGEEVDRPGGSKNRPSATRTGRGDDQRV